MNRATARYLALLALVTALFYWKTLLTRQFTMLIGSETVNYTYSWHRFWVDSLRHGRVPLWDPYAFSGRPFAGEMLPSAYYPLHLLFLLFPFDANGLFSDRLYHLTLIVTHLLCALFSFALLRELRLSRFAAFVGACAFSMSGLLVSMIWPPFVEAGIWLPAIAFFLLRAFGAEGRRAAVFHASLSGLCLGMSILTGGLHFSLMQGIFVVTATLYYGVSSDRARWRRVALILAITLGVAGGAGAVQLLPSYEYSGQSLRFIDGGAFPANVKIPYHRLHPGMWPQSIVSALFPTGFGGKIGGGEAFAIYIGVLPLFLAITAIWKCWGNLWVRYLTGLAVLAFLFCLGAFSPLHGVLYALVPFLWVVRASARFVYLASFALSILAAFGLETLLDRAGQSASWGPARRILKWVAIACAAALFVPGVFGQLDLGIWTALSLLLILASCGLFAYLTTHYAGSWARVLLAALVLFDLSAFHWVEADKAAPSKPAGELDQMVSLRGVAAFLKAQPGLGRVRVAVSPEPNIGDAYGVESTWGGGGTLLTDYMRLLPLVDLLNVRYIVKPVTAADPGPVYQDARWKVYENPKAFPRAWIVHQAIVEESHEAALRRIENPATDLGRLAVLETPLPEPLEPGPEADDKVRFHSYQPDRILLEATTGSKAMLVFSELYYPGWRATVNGKAAEIHKVNAAFRGLVLPAGDSRIVLEYAPLSFYAGAGLSLLTFAGVLAGVAVSVAPWSSEYLRVLRGSVLTVRRRSPESKQPWQAR